MMRRGLLVICLLLAPAWAWAAEPSAASLRAQIKQNGAEAVVRELRAGRKPAWEGVLRRIAAGPSEWLAVAVEIRSGTDAATGEALSGVLARALLKNPEGTLSITGEAIPLEQVCTVPMIEPTPTQIRRYKAKAASALRTVGQPALQSRRRQCEALFAGIR